MLAIAIRAIKWTEAFEYDYRELTIRPNSTYFGNLHCQKQIYKVEDY